MRGYGHWLSCQADAKNVSTPAVSSLPLSTHHHPLRCSPAFRLQPGLCRFGVCATRADGSPIACVNCLDASQLAYAESGDDVFEVQSSRIRYACRHTLAHDASRCLPGSVSRRMVSGNVASHAGVPTVVMCAQISAEYSRQSCETTGVPVDVNAMAPTAAFSCHPRRGGSCCLTLGVLEELADGSGYPGYVSRLWPVCTT